MMRKYLFFGFLIFCCGCSSKIDNCFPHPKPYNEVYYRFEKGLFLPNKYYLTIINHSERTVRFFTGHEANYLTFRNGLTAPINISRGLFDYMDKGMLWISPGEKMSIAFNIPGFEMREAVTATFKCTSGIQNQNGYNSSIEDEKALIVIYDVRTTEFSVKENKDNPVTPLDR